MFYSMALIFTVSNCFSGFRICTPRDRTELKPAWLTFAMETSKDHHDTFMFQYCICHKIGALWQIISDLPHICKQKEKLRKKMFVHILNGIETHAEEEKCKKWFCHLCQQGSVKKKSFRSLRSIFFFKRNFCQRDWCKKT